MIPKIIIIATGWNCEQYARKCVECVLAQKYDGAFQLIVVNDGSTDGTEKSIANIESNRLSVFNYSMNMGAAFRRWEIMCNPKWNPEDVFLLLGLDDELLPDALRRIAQQYDGGAWMTYGTWIDQFGKSCPVPLDFNKDVHYHRDYRIVQYRSTAPNTFKKKLIDKLTPEDFKYKGEWVKTCTETNLMFCCLEMCGEHRIGIIRTPIYLYNRKRADGSILRFGAQFKAEVLQHFQQRPQKRIYEEC